MGNATISEVAKMAGVSTATVSRVINNLGIVSPATKAKVKNAIRLLDYSPSAAARSLSTQESNCIGLIIPDVANPFFAEVAHNICIDLHKNGLISMLYQTADDARMDIMVLESIRQQRLGGAIYIPGSQHSSPLSDERIKHLIRILQIPLVLFDQSIAGISQNGVFSDNFGGGHLCGNALVDAGNSNIVVIAGEQDLKPRRDRLDGFKAALVKNGLELPEERILLGNFEEDQSYAVTKKYLLNCKGSLPDAFFVCNNTSSRGFLKAVFELGYTIPKDFAYLGYDPLNEIEIFGYRYSSLDRDIKAMCKKAVELLLRQIQGEDDAIEQVFVTPTLRLFGSERKG